MKGKLNGHYGMAGVCQIIALVGFFLANAKFKDAEMLFYTVKEFSPVQAICSKSWEYEDGDGGSRYDNTYMYEVDGKIYHVTYFDEGSRGSTRTIYYNPTNPGISSLYRTFNDFKSHNIYQYFIVVLMQGGAVLALILAIWESKRKRIEEIEGVVIKDDFDVLPGDERISEDTEEDELERIPFKRDKIPYPVERTEEINGNEPDFPLYTEEEYQKLNLKGE